MPNFDGGRYFLTALAPISNRIVDIGDGPPQSGAQILRDTLACLPTARQSPASEQGALNSPFARNKRTHFARFVVLDDVVDNGRLPTDALKSAITGTDLTIPQAVDHLSTPYLIFVADFDAANGDEAELRGYLTGLWEDMATELREIFRHCVAFESVNDGPGFADYILRCQIETTMPFNDYWIDAPPLKDMNLKALLAPTAITAITAIVAAVFWLLAGLGLNPGDALTALLGIETALAWGWISLAAGGVTAALGYASYRYIIYRARKPLPTAPDSDLPSVLKALYLQQRFTTFAIDQQGADPEALYQAFGEFLAEHRPEDLDQATQAPGVIRS